MFTYRERHILIIYDDHSKQAQAYPSIMIRPVILTAASGYHLTAGPNRAEEANKASLSRDYMHLPPMFPTKRFHVLTSLSDHRSQQRQYYVYHPIYFCLAMLGGLRV